jgi:AcrR family transcriptional regulator
MPDKKTTTQDRILQAFVDLVSAHGYEGSTTRAVADAAGVNEVTLFRHFGDKASLARAAFKAFSPNADLAAYDPAVDASDPAKAAADLCRCLIFVRDTLRDHPMLVNPVLRDLARRIGQGFERDVVPDPAFTVIQQALAKAKPVLRPEVDLVATSLSLLGLVVIYLMEERYLPSAEIANGDRLFAAALRPLIVWKPEP